MLGSYLESISRAILLIIAALVPLCRAVCDDVRTNTESCWNEYDSLLYTYTEERSLYFYSGIDVEQLRQFCWQFQMSVDCVQEYIDRECPESVRADVLLSQHSSVADMCFYNNLYELYAQTQSCFIRLRDSSEFCFSEFKTHTNAYLPQVREDDPNAINMYCRRADINVCNSGVRGFVDCLETRVSTNCERALPLVGFLINASLPLSYKCQSPQIIGDEHLHGGDDYPRDTASSLYPSMPAAAVLLIFTLLLHRVLHT